jgi:hypothetical protein
VVECFIIVTTFLARLVRIYFQIYRLVQLRNDAAQCAVDCTREQEQRRNDDESDHGENDAVLGHRLALLIAKAGEPVLK